MWVLSARERNESTIVCDDHIFHSFPLSPSIKLQILLLCFHTFLTEAVKISIELNLRDHVLNSYDLILHVAIRSLSQIAVRP